MSESKALDQQIKDMGRVPNGERVVSMVEFRCRIFVATDYHVYEVIDQMLIPMEFQAAGSAA
jgi:hypothetical protein